MRLSLRTLLAFEDNVFDMEQHRQLERTIPTHEPATRALSRIRDVVRDPRLGVPGMVDQHEELDPNLVAEYLDHRMSPEYLEQFESYCFSDDRYLAEVASVHQIVSNVLGEPARTNRDCRLRCYHLYQDRKDQDRKEASRTEPPPRILRYPEPKTTSPESEKTAAPPPKSGRKFHGIVLLLLTALLVGLLLAGWARFRKERSGLRFDRKESHAVLPEAPKEFPPKPLPEQSAFSFAAPSLPVAAPKSEPEPAPIPSTPPVEPPKPEPVPAAPVIAAVDPFFQAASAAPPDPVVPPTPIAGDPWNTPLPEPEPKPNVEPPVIPPPAVELSTNPLREETPSPPAAPPDALIATVAVEEKDPFVQPSAETPKTPPPRSSSQEEPKISFQGIARSNVAENPLPVAPETLEASPHRLEYQAIAPSPFEVAATPIADPVEPGPLRQTSLIIPMGGLAEEKPKPLKVGNPLQAPNLRCCVKESPEPCVVFTAKSAESPWSMETKELNLRSNQYLLTAAPFRADLELGAFQVEMIGDSKLCILPPDERGVPGLFLDYGRLVLRLREDAAEKSGRLLRIQTEKTEGLVSIDGPRSLVFIDTFAEIIETSGNVRESTTLGAPVRTDAILGLLPDPAESVSWHSKDREKPLIARRETSVLLAEGRSDEGSIRNHPNWLRRLSLSPECRELEAACRRAFEKHPGNCEAALQELIHDASPTVRSYGFRLWGDLGRFDVPLTQMSRLDETEEPLRKILVAYFRDVMKRDAETVQRLADAIDAARR